MYSYYGKDQATVNINTDVSSVFAFKFRLSYQWHTELKEFLVPLDLYFNGPTVISF